MDKSTSVHDTSIEDLKKKLWDSLMDDLIDSMLHGNATIKDAKESAQFMIDRLDPLKTKNELMQFLFDLQTKWKIYNPVYIKTKYVFEKEADSQKIKELKSKLYTFIKPN